ncbi:MAG: sigma-70 family RNA polymerase sigma factor [Actinomycetota bacterium]
MDEQSFVGALRAGDPKGLAAFYDQYADKLYDFARRQLRDSALAADVVHDTVLIVNSRISQLRDDSKFRAWVYAIARNEVRAKARARSRAVPTEDIPEATTDPDFAGDFERRELARVVDEAAAGLTERELEVFHLFARQGLSGDEIATALDVSLANAHKLVQRVRERISRSAGALLVARQGSRDCAELADVLTGWDGKFSPLWRKRIARHVDDCAECEKKRAVLLAPGGAVLAAPFLLAPSALRERILASAARGAVVQPSPAPRGRFFSNKKVFVGSAAAVVLVVGGVLTVGANRSVAPSVDVATTVAVTTTSLVEETTTTSLDASVTTTTESPVTNVTRKPATTVVTTQSPRTTVVTTTQVTTAPVTTAVATTVSDVTAPATTAAGTAQQAQVPTTTVAIAPAVKVTLPTVNTKPVFVTTTTVATNAAPVITQFSCKWDGKGYFVMLDVVDPNGDAILKNSVRESNSNPVFAVDASKTGSTSRYFGTVASTSPKLTVTYFAKDMKGAQGSLTRVLSSSACA